MTIVTLGPINGLVPQPSVVNSSSGTIAAIAAPAATEVIRVYKLFLVLGGITNITFEDGSTALCGPLPMLANGSITLDNDGLPWFTTSPGNAFNILNSGAVLVAGTVYYTVNTS